ncbi:hypothetical protein [Cuspidothrix issatschenkoi]|jgi:hypothetical protein|uniref:hypothetical protein n=1 Tax=Cuspidothrix issatschenkoi TaxID=230752 RepID=UPI0013FE44CA|nr:hypothetical protein [Cuspidothrix issatschenkoi]
MSNSIPPENPNSDELTDDLDSPSVVNSPVSNSKNPQLVVETSKNAVLDVWSALKLIWNDPNNGLQTAINSLGDSRIFYAGIALCILFVLAAWMAVLKTIESLAPLFSFGGLFGASYSTQLSFSEQLRVILAATIPVLGMIAVLWITRKIFKGSGNYQQFTFVTGCCFAPITFFLFMLWLLGSSATELMALISVFCWTTFVLFLNTALIGVLGLSSRNALLLVPIVLVADFFITRVGLDILY